MSKGKQNLYYAIYRGDEFLAHGPLEEIAHLFNMQEKSIREMAHKSYYKRVKKAKNPDEWLIAVKVEPLTKEDLIITHRKRMGWNESS